MTILQSRRDQILTLIDTPEGITGVAIAEALGISASVACTHLGILRADGLAHKRAYSPGCRMGRIVRWFRDPAVGDAWRAALVESSAQARAGIVGAKLVVKQAPAVDAPVSLGKGGLKGEPIITEQTKITRDERKWPTARWQMREDAPDPRWPSFSSTPLGINPQTGRAW